MAKIETYPLSTPVVPADKWIGTDVTNNTKNFSANAVAIFMNSFNRIESQSLRYQYQDLEAGDARLAGTISFDSLNTGTVPLSSITNFKLSKQQINNAVDVSTYYTNPLLQSTVLVSRCSDPSTFAIYEWDSASQDAVETDFWNIGVTYATGYGSLVDEKDYFISLLTYNTSATNDKYFRKTLYTKSLYSGSSSNECRLYCPSCSIKHLNGMCRISVWR